MELGYFMMPLHHIERDYHTTLEEDAEAIIFADELGYSEAWVGEHYTSAVEQITSPLQFLSSLIHRTRQITFATGVICMPQYHPGVTAGQAAMFDHMSKGRFIMGVGPGGLPSDFELFGVMDADRNEMMVEALDHILALWEGEPPYDLKGKYWNIKMPDWTHHDIKLGYVAKPFQQPHPPIAVSGMSPFSGSMTLAGSRGYIPVSANFIGEWSVASHWPAYLKGAKETGLEPDQDRWRVARSNLRRRHRCRGGGVRQDPRRPLRLLLRLPRQDLRTGGPEGRVRGREGRRSGRADPRGPARPPGRVRKPGDGCAPDPSPCGRRSELRDAPLRGPRLGRPEGGDEEVDAAHGRGGHAARESGRSGQGPPRTDAAGRAPNRGAPRAFSGPAPVRPPRPPAPARAPRSGPLGRSPLRPDSCRGPEA